MRVEMCPICRQPVYLTAESVGSKIAYSGTCNICGCSYIEDQDARDGHAVLGPDWIEPEEVDLSTIVSKFKTENPDFDPKNYLKEPLFDKKSRTGVFITKVDEDGIPWGYTHTEGPYSR